MNRFLSLLFILILFLQDQDLFAVSRGQSSEYNTHCQDTTRNRQLLYNGHLWRNPYNTIKGDPYFISNLFINGTVNIDGHTFSGISLKYDICADELLILKDMNEILQANKEMIRFFSFDSDNKTYRFIRFANDSLKYFSGYLNELYKGKISLYVKYTKEIVNIITGQYLGEFKQMHRIFVVIDGKGWQVRNISDVSNALKIDKKVLRGYMKKNGIKISAKDPESFVPLIRYFDSSTGN